MIKKSNLLAQVLKQEIVDAGSDDEFTSLNKEILLTILKDIMEDFDSLTKDLVNSTDAKELQTFLLHPKGRVQSANLLKNPVLLRFNDQYDQYRSIRIMLSQI
ncbi:hypothetical protein QAD02_018319 [Eretmocerus hayati]|uniref:Uncharacterized protein n=1 Tax=Eretmocerus hayati TaxID=131215 RepID=A0ACC2PJF4_9HYME|nr:hypothetical protein QAD02_018319 [Eretmocerus hayati]